MNAVVKWEQQLVVVSEVVQLITMCYVPVMMEHSFKRTKKCFVECTAIRLKVKWKNLHFLLSIQCMSIRKTFIQNGVRKVGFMVLTLPVYQYWLVGYFVVFKSSSDNFE